MRATKVPAGARRGTRRVIGAAAAALVAVLFLAGCTASTTPTDQPTEEARVAVDQSCGAGEITSKEPQRYINLVLDDSGSMFFKSTKEPEPHARWSQAKYALEVFTAMLRPEDTLNVYLLSDSQDSPSITVRGDDEKRLTVIHEMDLAGINRTPYDAVERASADLAGMKATADESSADPGSGGTPVEKWLVVLTDGQFDGVNREQVRSDFEDLVEADAATSVAFLSIGDDSLIDAETHSRIYTATASDDLVDQVTVFANNIFQRSEPPAGPGLNSIEPDIPLDEVVVFAQGDDVSVRGEGGEQPDRELFVSWSENAELVNFPDAPRVPDKDLNGVLAVFKDIPPGRYDFQIEGASTVAYYFTPRADFGVKLVDADGELVERDKIVSGEYTVRYGFMDETCEFIQESEWLGDIEYTAIARTAEDPEGSSFVSGEMLDLTRGDADLDVVATFLDGHEVTVPKIELTVQQQWRPTEFAVSPVSYNVSNLDRADPPPGPIEVEYRASEQSDELTAEEWDAVKEGTITVSGPDGLTFEAEYSEEIGEVVVIPQAADGDIYAVPTGPIEFTIAAEYVYDGEYKPETVATVTIVDDIPWYERFLHWFVTIGWLFLLGLILAVIILGYIIKPRFSKKVKASPTVTGVPMNIGMQAENGKGKFRQRLGRKFLPFFADRATLVYVPHGAPGFRAMQLKAGRRGKMTLLNWKQIADRKNVAINGTDLNEDTRKPPTLSPSSNITATVPNQMRYELYLNN